jgi:hypothetical protein
MMLSVNHHMRPTVYMAVLLFLCSCTKYEEVIVPHNIAPTDPTVNNNIYEDYVNRSYIIAMGREPSSAEFTADYNLIYDAKLSAASRQTFADSIFSDADYRLHSYEETRFDLLQTNDTQEMLLMIAVFDSALVNPALAPFHPIYQMERNRMQLTLDAKNLYLAGSIDIKEVHKRLVNNFLFDQINMGSQNFVLAVFQHLINRNPTQYELSSSVAMVDGVNSIVFLQLGNSKDNFLDIIFSSLNYHEGQIFKLYEKYLLRTPDTQEMTSATQNYFTTNDYEKAQKNIITTNEFVGLK